MSVDGLFMPAAALFAHNENNLGSLLPERKSNQIKSSPFSYLQVCSTDHLQRNEQTHLHPETSYYLLLVTTPDTIQ
jgi:hypothetical protein